MLEMDNLMASPLTGVNYVTASFGTKPGNDAGLNVAENGTPYTGVNDAGCGPLSNSKWLVLISLAVFHCSNTLLSFLTA